MRWCLADFKRGLMEHTFLLALGMGCISMGVACILYVMGHQTYTAEEAFKSSHALIVPFIAPLLCALPYANMNMLEADCGYKKLLILRNKGRAYTLKRWWVNALLGGLVLFIPSLLLMGICRSFGGYEESLLIGQVVGLNFFFGAAYSSFAYSLTFFNTKRYIPLLAPQVLYLLFIYAFPYLKLERFFPPLTFSPWIMPQGIDLRLMVVELGIILGLSLILMGWGIGLRKGVDKWLQ